MEEIKVVNVDGSTLKVSKTDWTYYKKEELEEIKARQEAELAKINALLEKF